MVGKGWTEDDQEKHLSVMAKKLARKCRSSVVGVDDFAQIGRIAIADAKKRYDPAKGASFKTFALHRARGAMYDLLRENDWVPRLVRIRKEETPQMLALDVLDENGEYRQRVADAQERAAFDRDTSEARLHELVAFLVEPLTLRERHIVTAYYVHGLTMAKIARRVRVTESRLCQILAEIHPTLERRARQYAT